MSTVLSGVVGHSGKLARQQQQQQQQQHFISPHNIQEITFITIVQTMTGALAARNNLRVKNARQPVKRKDVKMCRSGTQEQRKQRNAHKELSKLPVY